MLYIKKIDILILRFNNLYIYKYKWKYIDLQSDKNF